MIHFIRPIYLILLLIWPIFIIYTYKRSGISFDFKKICDSHLLTKILVKQHSTLYLPLIFIATIILLLILALAGPSLKYDKIPSYKKSTSHIILFDLSEEMLSSEIKPSKLQIAKFKLQDILNKQNIGQFALITYSNEAFLASPITNDGKTIIELIPYLNPNIMPIQGNNLLSGLKMAGDLIKNTPEVTADILVITGTHPDKTALNFNTKVKTQYLIISDQQSLNPNCINFTPDEQDIETWLNNLNYDSAFNIAKEDTILIWQDEGKWLILLAILLLAVFFRKSYFERIL